MLFHDRWPAGFLLAELPSPEYLEALLVPSDDGGGFNEVQCLWPTLPELAKEHPEEPVGIGNPRLKLLDPAGSQLLAQGDIFKDEFLLRHQKHPDCVDAQFECFYKHDAGECTFTYMKSRVRCNRKRDV